MEPVIEFHELCRAADEKPHCYVLKVDEFRFLLDCGWDENFNPHFINELREQIDSIDAVLLTHPDIYHLGALPYAVGKLGLSCPVFATCAVYKMGQMAMYDVFQSRDNTEDFDLFTLDDVDAAFDLVNQLHYNQTVNLQGKGLGMSISALRAGHMVGGAIWKIVRNEEVFIYAVDCNHEDERHLNGGAMATIRRPSLLISDVSDSNCAKLDRSMREEKLMDRVRRILEGGGNVLLPVDASGRVLELACVLDRQWQKYRLLGYSLVLLSNVGFNAFEFAKCQLEWMSDEMNREFVRSFDNPFAFKHVKFCHSVAELERVPGPKVVLATSPDMESGFSRDVFRDWCSDRRNAVVLTTRTCPGSLARRLIDCPELKCISLEVRKRVEIKSRELDKDLVIKKGKKSAGNSIKISDDKLEDVSVKSFAVAFPFEEKGSVGCDDYGENVNAGDFLFLDFNQCETERLSEEEEEEVEETLHVPRKCVRSQEVLEINCCVEFVNFEGRSDGESNRRVVSSVEAHRVVNVRGWDDTRWDTICSINWFVSE